MKSPRCLLVVALAACGSSTPTPESHPTLDPAPADAAHRDASDDVTAVASQVGSLANRTTIPRELARMPLYVRDLDGLMLFDDEQAV
ncbi:MAG: hypothetical protein ABI678_32830, partial [Kofleriaceae bacterium]